MTISMPDVFKISVKGAAQTAARTEIKARSHIILVDEPKSRHGTDLAATPLETLLSSFLACTNVITNIVAAERGIEINGMEMSLTAHFDTRGVFDKAEVTVPFPRIEMAVVVDTRANKEDVEALGNAVARRCPVSVVLRQAGTRIEDTWSVR